MVPPVGSTGVFFWGVGQRPTVTAVVQGNDWPGSPGANADRPPAEHPTARPETALGAERTGGRACAA